MKQLLKRLSKTQRILLVVVGLVSIGAIGLLGYVEYASSQYVEHNDRDYDEAREIVYQGLASDRLTLQGLADIEATARQASDSLCQTTALVQWRVSGDYQAECEVQRQQLKRISQQTDILVKRIEAEQAVATIFVDATDRLDKVEAGDYRARQDLWSQVSKDLAGLSGSEVEHYQEYLPTHQSAVGQIIDRYDKLLAADRAKNRSKFDDAAIELQAGYESLSKSSSDVRASYQEQVISLLDEVELLLAPRVQMNQAQDK